MSTERHSITVWFSVRDLETGLPISQTFLLNIFVWLRGIVIPALKKLLAVILPWRGPRNAVVG